MANRQTKPSPLKWRAHRIARSSANSLRAFTESVGDRMMRTIPLPVSEAAGGNELSLPELPDDPQEKAARLLQAAAEVEHALLVQYLYAGYGFHSPNRDVLGIAIEEMSHLMTVQNLLRLIGKDPHLLRQDFGMPASLEERLFPFELLLEPLSKTSLAKYIVAESPENVPGTVDPGVMAIIVNEATQGGGESVNRVGTLYALLGAVFGSEQLLLQKAASGDAWYVLVNSLAAEAAIFYGGRDKLHLSDPTFQPGSVDLQGTDEDWDRSVEKSFDEFRVHVVGDREQAVEALRDIGLQGEGPTSIASELSHYQRFYDLFVKFFGPDGMGTNPVPGVLSVPRSAVIAVDSSSNDPDAITHPDTIPWAQLADIRYGILLGSLDLYLRASASERKFLRGWCFAEMFAIGALSGFLVIRPRSATPITPEVAALPFNLPNWSGSPATWDDLLDAFTESLALIPTLKNQVASGSEESRILYHLMSSDQRKKEGVQALKTGGTARTKADKARDVLDWAAGAGNPHHSGVSPQFPSGNQGRFWNLPLPEFKQTQVFGTNIIEDPGGGNDPFLIEVLREGFMPKNRPSLSETSEEFQFLEDWVKGGCPDETA